MAMAMATPASEISKGLLAVDPDVARNLGVLIM
jgi:hypothetical protein